MPDMVMRHFIRSRLLVQLSNRLIKKLTLCLWIFAYRHNQGTDSRDEEIVGASWCSTPAISCLSDVESNPGQSSIP